MVILGAYFTDEYTKEQLCYEVDTALEYFYGGHPDVIDAIKYQYTDWGGDHMPGADDGKEYMERTYDRSQVVA